MKVIVKYACLVWLVTSFSETLGVEKSYTLGGMDSTRFHQLLENYARNKILPDSYEAQALIALSHYPELKHTKIKFQFVKSGIPLTARPTVWSTIFRSAKKRTYLITIAKDTDPRWSAILLRNLPYNAQVGVIGHEIAHIADFSKRSLWGMLQVLFGNLSERFMDSLEYNTDFITIQHGLGYQLLAWSSYVREVLQLENEQADTVAKQMSESERYMSPGTIRRYMDAEGLYLGE